MITNNMPKEKLAIVAVSRDCFPMSLSERRRKAVVEAYQASYGEIYECPVCIENEIHMRKALADVKSTADTAASNIEAIVAEIGSADEVTGLYALIDAAQDQANTGVANAATAQGAAEAAQGAIDAYIEANDEALANVKATAEEALDATGTNAAAIEDIKADYVSFGKESESSNRNCLFAGEDIIIFNCGGASETIVVA